MLDRSERRQSNLERVERTEKPRVPWVKNIGEQALFDLSEDIGIVDGLRNGASDEASPISSMSEFLLAEKSTWLTLTQTGEDRRHVLRLSLLYSERQSFFKLKGSFTTWRELRDKDANVQDLELEEIANQVSALARKAFYSFAYLFAFLGGANYLFNRRHFL